jgi:hypothetical protein
LLLEKEADAMRVSPLLTAAVIALTNCVAPGCTPSRPPTPTPTPTPSPTPRPTETDLTIGINLQLDLSKKKCVVGFDLPAAKSAVAYTGYQVIWRITKNECGDLKKKEIFPNKALGLRFLRDKAKKHDAKWSDRCTTLPFVPREFVTPPEIRCFIPWEAEGNIVDLYEYGLDGDSVEPLDPELDVRKGH